MYRGEERIKADDRKLNYCIILSHCEKEQQKHVSLLHPVWKFGCVLQVLHPCLAYPEL